MLNKIITARGYSSYLEIGLGNGKSFDRIVCETKVGVDPVLPPVKTGRVYQKTSNEFFANNELTFDCIFVDGLHHYRQALLDIENALQCLNPNGLIMVHDCDPPSQAAQQVPRNGEKIWTGDVWRAWIELRKRSDLHQVCIAEDYGCGIITKSHQPAAEDIDPKMSYEDFDLRRSELLNLISWEDYERNYL